MIQKKTTIFTTMLAGLVAVVLAVPAAALSVDGTYTVSGDAFSDPGLVINTDPSSGAFSLGNLEVGESRTVPLFDIFTTEGFVNADDRVPQPVNVAFNLSSPATAGAVTGETVGVSTFFGLFQKGKLTWDGPTTMAFGNGGELTFALSDGYFNKGVGGLWCSECGATTVKLTGTYDVAPIPLPAAGWLMLAGFGGLAALRRRQKRQTA